MNLLTKQKQTHSLKEWIYGCQEEGWGEGIVREFGMDVYTLLCLKQITSKRLPVWHRELCSMLCGSLDGRGVWRRMDICICMAECLCCPPESVTTLLTISSVQSLSHVWLCDPMDCSLLGFSVHGISQARTKSDREGEISYDIPYMWNLKRNDTNELIFKT